MMEISFDGGVTVNAAFKGFVVKTDQPAAQGGEGSAPSPFDLFLASVGTCAGFFALRFCQERRIDTEGLRLWLDATSSETKKLALVRIKISLPELFPEKYRVALIKATEQCAVKRALEDPPVFETLIV